MTDSAIVGEAMKSIFLSFFCIALGFHAVADATEPISLQVRIQDEKSAAPSLSMSVTNNTTTSLTFRESDLPWGGRHSLIVSVVPVKEPRTPLTPIFYFDNPMSDRVTIGPSKAVQGKVNLSSFVKDLQGARARSDVIVFWSYLPIVDGKAKFERLGGFEVLKATSSISGAN